MSTTQRTRPTPPPESAPRPATPTLRDPTPATDLFTAAARGDSAAVQWHLARGAAPDTLDPEGHTPLARAACGGHRRTVRLLLDAGARPHALHAAVAGGDAIVVGWLLARGATVDARDEAGFTPLHQAICQGDAALVTCLLKAGADPRLEIGDTGSLALARRCGAARIVGLLRQRGAVR